jgi:hypothetical protein
VDVARVVPVARVVSGDLAVQVVLVEWAVPAEQVELVGLGAPVVQGELAV